MFAGLTPSAILTNATTWVQPFEGILLVVVGVGLGFACVRFVRGLFF